MWREGFDHPENPFFTIILMSLGFFQNPFLFSAYANQLMILQAVFLGKSYISRHDLLYDYIFLFFY